MTATRGGITTASVDALTKRVSGTVIGEHHADYEGARRVWNGNIDKRPALIVRCASTADVVETVRFARDNDLLLAVRGGGHNVAGLSTCEGGVVLDLSSMRAVSIDAAAKRATVQGGALWSDVDGASQQHGLAMTGGFVSHTGVGGLTLGGGIGWLMRSCGLTIDHLVGAEVVTADGSVVRATAEQEPELFWGLRGGGGNFGVVTSFEFKLHDVGPELLCGGIFHNLSDAPEFLRFCREYLDSAPRELGAIGNLRLAPALPAIPEALHGNPVAAMLVCWNGDPAQGEKVLEPLRKFGNPALDNVSVKPYIAHQSALDAAVPHGRHYYWKSSELPALTDNAVDALCEHVGNITSPFTTVPVFYMGGAVQDTPDEETPYAGRQAMYNVNVAASWAPDDPEPLRHVEWVRRFWSDIDAESSGVYVNFLSDDHERVKRAYGEKKYERLAAAKRRYDPDNLFRLNYNVPPAR